MAENKEKKDNTTPEKDSVNSSLENAEVKKKNKFSLFSNKKEIKKMEALESKEMNFLERYEFIVEGKVENFDLKEYKKQIIMFIAFLLVITVFLAGLWSYFAMSSKILSSYINNANNKAKYEEAVSINQKVQLIQKGKSEIESSINIMNKYPNFNADFNSKILNAASANSMKFESINYGNNSGLLTLSCVSPTPKSFPAFLRTLVGTSEFIVVSYSSYSGNSESQYKATITGYLKGN